jgi:hypothetical protein
MFQNSKTFIFSLNHLFDLVEHLSRFKSVDPVPCTCCPLKMCMLSVQIIQVRGRHSIGFSFSREIMERENRHCTLGGREETLKGSLSEVQTKHKKGSSVFPSYLPASSHFIILQLGMFIFCLFTSK